MIKLDGPSRSFTRHGLTCFTRPQGNADGIPAYGWGVSGRQGAAVWITGPVPDEMTPVAHMIGCQQIGGRWWMGWDLGIHSRQPREDCHRRACMWLDGAACWYETSSMGAADLLAKAAGFSDEGDLWDTLSLVYLALLDPDEGLDAWIRGNT